MSGPNSETGSETDSQTETDDNPTNKQGLHTADTDSAHHPSVKSEEPSTKGEVLFQRVAQIIEQAQERTVRAVNQEVVVAYWLIGREIVEHIQAGEKRAEYGKAVIKDLSTQLTKVYGKGYSVSNLSRFRQFYQCFSDRMAGLGENIAPPGRRLVSEHADDSASHKILAPAGREFDTGFAPNLSWSHYRALMTVKDDKARQFYEREAVECGWAKAQLERQIQTAYYERIIQHHGEQGLIESTRERLPGEKIPTLSLLKSPYVLEFLDLPDTPDLHESQLEQAIISNLQSFLLELGKGFSFVARQKHIRFEDDDFYVDLVFYNYILKCFLLIDLKLGKLNHRDVGQMDGYVRLYEDRFKVEGDNPTIGLILCSDKSEAVAKYSVLNESKQIFASKYLNYLPSEHALKIEIEKERALIETRMEEQAVDGKVDGDEY